MKTLKSPIIYFILVALLYSLITTTNATVLEDFCKETGIDSCMRLLQSNPRASSASTLFELGSAIIQQATKSATDGNNLIEGFLRNRGLPPVVLKGLATCDSIYGEVVAYLKKAASEASVRKFGAASQECFKGRNDVDSCRLAMPNNPIGKVSEQNEVVYYLCALALQAMLELQ